MFPRRYLLLAGPKRFSRCIFARGMQHTPDVHAAFAALPPMLAKGGRLCVDVYKKRGSRAAAKVLLRPLAKRTSTARLSRIRRDLGTEIIAV